MGAPNRIKELRLKAGISLDELSAASGVARNSINLIENGKQELTVEKMRAIARALDMPPSSLLNDEDVEYRPAAGNELLADVLRQVPSNDQSEIARAARAVVHLATTLAVRRSAGALDGDDDQVDELATLWNAMDRERRGRALAVISASGFAEVETRFRPADKDTRPGRRR